MTSQQKLLCPRNGRWEKGGDRVKAIKERDRCKEDLVIKRNQNLTGVKRVNLYLKKKGDLVNDKVIWEI